MTREEAIIVLKYGMKYRNPKNDTEKDRNEALDMAISALFENKGEGRPKGHWIEVVTGRFPNGEKRTWHYECSACGMGEPPHPIDKDYWDFCPNCGTDIRGKAE